MCTHDLFTTHMGEVGRSPPMYVHDLELARRCAEGDEAAWSKLARAAAAAAALAVTRVVGTGRRAADPTLEDEIASDTLVALAADSARLLRVYRGDAPIEAFLAALASRRAQHAVRARSRREAALARCASLERRSQRPAETSPAVLAMEHDELARAVKRGLDDLAAGDRLLLVLFHFDGRSYKDIARTTGSP